MGKDKATTRFCQEGQICKIWKDVACLCKPYVMAVQVVLRYYTENENQIL